MAKKTSLNKNLRTSLLRSIVTKAFEDRWQAHQQAEKQLGDFLYFEAVGNNGNAMLAFPRGFFTWDDSVRIEHPEIGRSRRYVRGGDENWYREWTTSSSVSFTKERPLPVNVGILFDYDDKHGSPSYAAIEAHAEAEQKLLAETEAYMETVNKLLYSVRTVEALVEAFPEAGEFVKQLTGAPAIEYPVVEVGLVERVREQLMVQPK